MATEQIINEYNKLFVANKLNWTEVKLEELPADIALYISVFVDGTPGVTFQMHRPVIGNTQLLKIEGAPPIKYLFCFEGSHMWGDEKFDNLSNNVALATLEAKKLGLAPEQVETIKELFDQIDMMQKNERQAQQRGMN